MAQIENNTADNLPKGATIPSNLQYSARAFADEDYAKEAMYKLHSVLGVISQSIDLTNLDGVTVAFDYDEALAELDRGYETNYRLTATKDVAIGVAMAPTVFRDGFIKTHLVLNANYALSILEEPGEETEYFWQSLHLVAHECAHVEVTAVFDRAFPGILLQKVHRNILDNMRWQVILAAWDEYAVCRITGSIGYDPTDDYHEVLLKVMEETRDKCYEMIKSYRTHGDVARVVEGVYGKLGDLIKYSSYYLGAVAAQKNPKTRPSALSEKAEFIWFKPFYERVLKVNEALWNEYGQWEDLDTFEAIGDVLEDMAKSVGIVALRESDDLINFHIPYRPESMPDSAFTNPLMRALLGK
jgi:hypothetical protein